MPLISHFPGGGGGVWSVFTGSTPPASEPEGVFVKTTASPAGVVVTNQVGGAGSWGDVAAMEEEFDALILCAYGDDLIIPRGVSEDLLLNRFNIKTHTLTSTKLFDQQSVPGTPDTIRHMRNIRCAVFNNILYFLGWEYFERNSSGTDYRGATAALSYDLASHKILKYTADAGQTWNIQQCQIGAKVYTSNKNRFYVTNLASNLLPIELTPMPRSRTNHCLVAVGNKIYAIGGSSSSQSAGGFPTASYTAPVDVYDTNSQTWSTSSLSYTAQTVGTGSLTVPIQAVAASVGTTIYVAEGTKLRAIDTVTMTMTELTGYGAGVGTTVCRVGTELYYYKSPNAIIQYRVAGDSYPKGTVVIETGAGRPPVKLAAGDVTYRDSVACAYQHDGTKLVKVPARDRQAGGAWSAEF